VAIRKGRRAPLFGVFLHYITCEFFLYIPFVLNKFCSLHSKVILVMVEAACMLEMITVN